MPTALGGLGIQDLHKFNAALHLCWFFIEIIEVTENHGIKFLSFLQGYVVKN